MRTVVTRSAPASPAAKPAAHRSGSTGGSGHSASTADCRLELERLHAMSFSWALYCCRQRREEAQDVLQEVYLRVLDGRARFAGQSSMRTWLFAVIRRTAGEQNRRRWLRTALMERWLQGQPASESSSVPEGESDSHDRLRHALAQLSQRQQEVLHLVFYQDLTIEEASDALGISLGSARTHFERGKHRLRECLQEDPMP
jgi:RNA polymerase sigma-70 factor (ECF subfamily)